MKPDGIPEPGLPLARPLTRRQLLAAGSFGALALFLEACGPAPAPSPSGSAGPLATPTGSPVPLPSAPPIPPLDGDQLRAAVAALPWTGTLAVPGGGSLKVADLQAAAAALAAPDGSGPSPGLNPVAALGYILAAADWSGASGALDLSRLFPGLALPIVRLSLARLPDGGPTAVIAGALPVGLTVRAGAALLVVSQLADGSCLVAIDDPARPIDGHPRLELGVVSAAALSPLLAVAGARLDAGGGAVVLADGTAVTLRPLTASLASRLAAASGALFVDRVPIQPNGAKTPLLTADPIVPQPLMLPGVAKVSPAKDGRILALGASGKAVGRAMPLADGSWSWVGHDAGTEYLLDYTPRELAAALGVRIGSTSADHHDPSVEALCLAQVNITTINEGMVWRVLEPQRGVFDFTGFDRELAAARAAGLRVRGHPLADSVTQWPFLPTWLTDGTFSKRELTDILVTHIERVVDRYKGRVDEWVVVNEPYLPGYGFPENDIFYNVIGPGYVDLAFETARRVDPSARLILNHFDNEHARGTVVQSRRVARRLRDAGLLDAVGLEMHMIDMDWVPGGIPTAKDVTATIRSYGMPCVATEFDYDMRNYPGTQAERYARQGDVYGRLVGALLDADVKEFTFWDLGDQYWTMGPGSEIGTMFDANFKPKPAYFAVRDVLKKRAGHP